MLTRIDTDLVRRDHPIGDVVARYGLELRRVGRALVGRCPLHADGGRPNLHVYPDNQSWYCYRCAVGGDVISFVMRVERLDFRAAVARLEGAGSPRGVVRARPVHRPKPERHRTRPWGPAERACLAAAVELYHNRLLGEPSALAYVEGRGIERATVERCRLGYATGDELATYLRWRRLPAQAALRVGLLGRDGREPLAGRVVVPEIRDGQPLWLVGRILADDGKRPKYLGLPGSKPLLGWEAAARSATAVLVEGVFDWLTLLQWGFPALALVGTRVRPAVLRALGAHFSRLYVALDADDAGQEAAAALVEALGPRAVPVRLPTGVKDVAELGARPDGRAVFAGALLDTQTRPAPLARAALSHAPVAVLVDEERTALRSVPASRRGGRPAPGPSIGPPTTPLGRRPRSPGHDAGPPARLIGERSPAGGPTAGAFAHRACSGGCAMAFPYNRVELIGRLGHDPELRYTPEGHAVAKFNLATDRPTRAGAEPETDWHQIVAWRKLGEFAGEYLAKGRLVFVAGRLTYRTWEGKDGQRRRTAEIVATELIPLDRRPEAATPEPSAEGEGDLPF